MATVEAPNSTGSTSEAGSKRRRIRWRSALSGADQAQSLLIHDQLLGQRLFIYALARFMVVGAIAVGALVGKYVVGISDLHLPGLFILAGLLAAYNAVVFVLLHTVGAPAKSTVPLRSLKRIMHATIALDFCFLTAALWLVGGAKSPFQVFYLFHVILASMLLSRRAAAFHATLGYFLLAALVVGQWRGFIPAYYPKGATLEGALSGRYVLTILTVQAILFALTTLSLTSVAQLLRSGERRLRRAKEHCEHMSTMRRDFLRIALHNLKSPVAAVTSLLDSLEFTAADSLDEQQHHFVDRARHRLQGLTGFIRDLQMLSELDSGQIGEQASGVDVGKLLRRLAEDNQDLAQSHRHTLRVEVPPSLPPVFGIERLLYEAIVNFVTNAIKYTPDGGEIVLRAVERDDLVRVEVEDNGEGIAPADQERLFTDFVRLGKGGTERVEGTGLGLSIVRRIAEAHGGRVGVESEEGSGSTFFVELPC